MRKIEGFWVFSTNSRGKTGGRAPANGHVRSAAARIRQGLGWGFFSSVYLGRHFELRGRRNGSLAAVSRARCRRDPKSVRSNLAAEKRSNGVVTPGCPARRKRLFTMQNFMDHLADDVLPQALDKLSVCRDNEHNAAAHLTDRTETDPGSV